MTTLATIVGQLLLGWLLADLVGGLVHWLEDRLLRPELPIVGRHVVEPNRLHHREPLAFTAGSFLDRNLTTWLATFVLAVPLFLVFGPSLVLIAATIGGAVASIVHYFAHRPSEAPELLRVLQEIGVIQSPKHHARHHRPPNAANYCPLTDWLNPVLEALGFWQRLERGLAAIGVDVHQLEGRNA